MIRSLIVATSLVALSGCASIFNGQTQSVAFKSEPDGANFTVTNRAGETIHTGTTPATITLKRGAGYFKSESYRVAYSKDGYAPREVMVTSTLSGWYIGNILVGGLIGMLGVDPATGGMYVFQESVSTTLEAASAPAASAANATLTIVSMDALPDSLRARARPLQ